jgi:F0F1-type ATP synthase membrane subunit a
MKMEKHITTVAALHIGLSIFGIIIGAFIFIILTAIGFASRDEDALAVLAAIGTIVSIFLFVLSVPGIIGGIGLLKRKEWARILILIVSAIDLINIPIGTALGVYSIWVLVNDETVKLFTAAFMKP